MTSPREVKSRPCAPRPKGQAVPTAEGRYVQDFAECVQLRLVSDPHDHPLLELPGSLVMSCPGKPCAEL